MIHYVNHLVKELQSIHENRLELANKLQLAMNSNTVSIIIYHAPYAICLYLFIYWHLWVH